MSLDHYVPQVHLRNWLSPALGQRFYAIRKSDLNCFTPGPKGVCAIRHGSTNRYLSVERRIEELLAEIEPAYNAAVEKLLSDRIDNESICTIAGIISCISSCSPTSLRLHTPFLSTLLGSTAMMMDKRGLFPKLRGVTVSELLNNGLMSIRVDGKYPQAVGIEQIQRTTTALGNCEWEVIRNNSKDSPFFTSDYPIALEVSKNYSGINNKIFPLSPHIAVRIKPDPSIKRKNLDQSFSNFTSRVLSATDAEVESINRLIVQSAEDLVFYRDDLDWIKSFVEKHRHYRIEAVLYQSRDHGRHMLVSNQRIVEAMPAIGKDLKPESNHWFELTHSVKVQ